MALIVLFSIQLGVAQISNNVDSGIVNTVLFKVTSSGNNHVSYLFGTHHAFGKEFFDSCHAAKEALLSCDVLIKENVNIPGEMAEDIINRRTEVTRWRSYLGRDELSYLEELFATSPTDYRKMTPTEMYVFLNRHFKQQVCLGKKADDTSLSLDDYIGAMAIDHGMVLKGLETTADQIVLINKDVEGMPRRAHKRRLTNIIEKIRTQNVNDCEEINWYARMAIDYQLQMPCRNALMLTDRNDKWVRKMTDLVEQKNCFIAIGLSHLMYECGLLNQLSDLGYTIKPMAVN